MKLTTQKISIIIVFAALYALGVIFLAPISFNIYQVRLADALLPLSMIFGFPSAIGLSLGCLVANMYGGLGMVDIVGGSAANLIACSLAWQIAKRKNVIHRFLGSLAETFVITLIVGGYLFAIFEVPIEFSFLGILVGSTIAINVIGYPVEEILNRSPIIKEYTSNI